MPYATAQDLWRWLSPRDVGQLVFDSDEEYASADVDEALLIADGVTASFSPESPGDWATLKLATALRESLEWSHSIADSFLSARHELPLTFPSAIPSALSEAVITLAKERLYARRNARLPEGLERSAAEAREWLNRVSLGRAKVVIEPAAGQSPASARQIYVGSRTPPPGTVGVGGLML
ncbi:MAG: DUF1320 domain-containing protein [Bacteroidetes bacterium]|nr:DUF1320 domain-containing protein [Bacteroidota bacterium]